MGYRAFTIKEQGLGLAQRICEQINIRTAMEEWKIRKSYNAKHWRYHITKSASKRGNHYNALNNNQQRCNGNFCCLLIHIVD